MTLLQKLEKYYEKIGIYATSFRCRYLEDCKGSSENFTEAMPAYIGPGYIRHQIPRLLFISLDPGEKSDWTPQSRTMLALQKDVLKNWKISKESRHWYYTHELTHLVLKQFLQKQISLKDCTYYFAHTNSAKCCQNKLGKKQADKRLFDHCGKFIHREVEILCPDIIITQGKYARYSIQDKFEELDKYLFVPNYKRLPRYIIKLWTN